MRITPGIYKNILELYKRSKDFREAFDKDKGGKEWEGMEKNGLLIGYMDDYSDRPGIVSGVLADVLDTNKYKYKVIREMYKYHQNHWREVKIEITLKKQPKRMAKKKK